MDTNWWGNLSLEEGQTWHLHMSTIHFILKKEKKSLYAFWKYAHFDSVSLNFGYLEKQNEDTSSYQKTRFPITVEHPWKLEAVLPPLPLVAKPIHSIYIEPQGNAKILVSIPLFLQFGSLQEMAFQIPLQTLFETWFGPHPTQGEICYISNTTATSDFSEINVRPFRAFCEIEIFNKSNKFLKIEKLKLPVSFLSLFQNKDRIFITDSLKIFADHDPTQSETTLTGKPLFPDAKLITLPKKENKGISKIITSLL